ncbi:MAG TPA: c-type cytochrome biogenesis protein CcsB, partial [Deltaproteobacteria bacterium]|nr:c-type cytochrome biogenesis protein CcsB [Deltaproteobacteria bacterium]
MSIYIFYLSLSIYLLSTVFYLLYLILYKKIIEQIGYYTLLSGFIAHLFSTLLRYMEAGYTPITNFHEALSFFALCIVCVFIYIKKKYRIDTIGSIILPSISLLLIWASFYPSDIKPLPPVLKSYWLPIHTIFSFLGNAIFFTGFFISIVYLITERSIKKKKLSALSRRFPSLETLD